ncbi:Radical SAM domain protein (plasmid) [Solidesulfovibrio carbinoliphilus subsp. oakridgensis]|uniref:Radical SAM domain protein n=1 Tax=Solidesulfovibrio carbinoliphilus subsp. oakridgensis TaxID=694327 RepID=G7QEB4_9BACT|nr:B12-binding domain-containing radical SAM protein [Solidesulfovibrio carbinoliphilus]EHJ46008.1 Radical SAM domain protein [Solidesulfovibrio carbinoliphilus subsp. oakridgensis]
MKILLVQSWLGGDGPPVYPVGLACLAASLPGHDVSCFDPNVAAEPLAGLAARVREFSPDLVGVSLRNIDSTNTRVNVSYLSPFARVVETVRREFAGPLVVGGSGFSMFADRIMADFPAIDYGVALEGERTFAALAAALARPAGSDRPDGSAGPLRPDRPDGPHGPDGPEQTAGPAADVAGVPSLHYRENGAVRFTGPAPASPLADLPSPDFSVLPLAPYATVPWGIGVETKRGCALACVYCPYGFLNGKAYRKKDPARVADELWRLQEDFGLTRFTFLDSVFNFPRDQAMAVMQAMVDRKLTLSWSAWFTERGLDREFLALARRAGCDTVIFSPDAFGDRALKRLGKATSVAEIKAAYRLVRDMGSFEVSYNFFKNPPGQTLFAFLAMAGFVVRARLQMGRRAHFEFNSLRVEPHTALAKLAVAEGVVAPDADLLAPVMYSQKRTAYIEKCFDRLLQAAGK